MKRWLLIASAILLPACVLADGGGQGKSGVAVSASLATKTGERRVFHKPGGDVEWAPSLPAYRGDRLTVAFTPRGSVRPERASVTLDGRSLADLKAPPWRVLIDTSKLSPGRHVVRADIRFPGTPRMYSIAEFPFYLRDVATEVKGTVQEFHSGPAGKGPGRTEVVAPRSFSPPADEAIKPGIAVTLHSSDPEVDRAIANRQPIRVTHPVTFRLDAKPGVDRWAYQITRDGRQIAGAGPAARSVYLEVAPKTDTEAGLLPGEVTLRVWGVRNDGAYSPAVVVPLAIEQRSKQ